MSEKESEHGDDSEMQATHWEFDVNQKDPEVDVVEIVAELEGVDTTQLSTLFRTIDNLIKQLYSQPPSPQAQMTLEFSYEGYRIRLNQDGHATFMKVAGPA